MQSVCRVYAVMLRRLNSDENETPKHSTKHTTSPNNDENIQNIYKRSTSNNNNNNNHKMYGHGLVIAGGGGLSEKPTTKL